MNNKRSKLSRFTALVLTFALGISSFSGCTKKNDVDLKDEAVIATSDAVTSVLSDEEKKKVDEISEKLQDESGEAENIINILCQKDEVNSEDVEKFERYVSETNKTVDNYIEIQNQLFTSVEDDISKDASTLLSQRKSAEENKIKEKQDKVKEDLDELKKAVDSEDKEKTKEIIEDINTLFSCQYAVYGKDGDTDKEQGNGNSNNSGKNGKSDEDSIIKVNSTIDDPDEVSEYFSYEFESPLEAYNYLKNSIYTEFYYGRKKTVISTYESCAGNDYDQAALLVSVLNSMGYEAKYVRGTIRLKPEVVLSMTGASDISQAADIMAMAGVPVTKLKGSDGNIKAIETEHVWVRANIPYTDYRGARNSSGNTVWVDLDTSIKYYEDAENVYDYIEKSGEFKDIYSDISGPLEKLNENINKEEKEIYNRKRKIKEEVLIYLPLSLQYEVKEETEVTESLDAGDTVSIYVSGECLGTYSAAYLSDKSCVVAFEPSTESDAEILAAYGDVFKVGANYVYVKPVLYINGIRISEAQDVEYTLGTVTTIETEINLSGKFKEKTKYIENKAISGSTYAITFDTGIVSSRELYSAYTDLYRENKNLTENNIFSVNKLGTLLDYSGKLYFAQYDAMNIVAAEDSNIVDVRNLSAATTGYEVKRKSLYGVVTKLAYGALFIDVDVDDHAVKSRDNDKDKEVLYRIHTGCMGSMCEGLIWSEGCLTNETRADSISTISVLGKATENDINIVTLSKDNEADLSILDNLSLSEEERSLIKTEISAGRIITIPEEDITIQQWKGTGCILLDPETGIGAYKISGNLNGGEHPLAATAMATLAIYAEYVTGTFLLNAIMTLTVPGIIGTALTLGGLLLIALGLTVLSYMMYSYMDYMINGGEDRFDKFLQYFMMSGSISACQMYYGMFLLMVEGMYQCTKAKDNEHSSFGDSIKISDKKMYQVGSHYNKHGRQMGYSSKKEYEQAARDFFENNKSTCEIYEGIYNDPHGGPENPQYILRQDGRQLIIDKETGQIMDFYEGVSLDAFINVERKQ